MCSSDLERKGKERKGKERKGKERRGEVKTLGKKLLEGTELRSVMACESSVYSSVAKRRLFKISRKWNVL